MAAKPPSKFGKLGEFDPKLSASHYFSQVFELIPRGLTLQAVMLEEEKLLKKQMNAGESGGAGDGEIGIEEEENVEDLTAAAAADGSEGMMGGTFGGNLQQEGGFTGLKKEDLDEEVAEEALKFFASGGATTAATTTINDVSEEAKQGGDAAGNNEANGGGLLQAPGTEGSHGNIPPATTAAPLLGEDPYYGLFEDPNQIHRGRCRLFHQQKGFGFIEPTPLRRPAGMPTGAKLPDVYFARDDILLSGSAKTAFETAMEATGDSTNSSRPGALHALCVEEEIEFKVVWHIPNTHRGGEGGDAGAGAAENDGFGPQDEGGAGIKKLKAIEITGPNRGPVRAHLPSNRHRGIIRHWNPQRDYGFIAPNTGGRDVFFHNTSLFWNTARQNRNVELGFVVEYAVFRQKSAKDREGKLVALAVSDSNFAGIDPSTIPRSTNAAVRREQDKQQRKRDRETDGALGGLHHHHKLVDESGAVMDGPSPTAGGGGGGELGLGVGDDDNYATW